MWLNWLPWRFIVKRLARRHGFFDPFALISRLQRFAQPSEVAVPIEVMRIGALLQARGLLNAQAIQHNLDWVWPYWVRKQFDPRSTSFIPRAFSLTHINLSHRNWTAVGLPDIDELPVVDPRGLVMPFIDSSSIDAWLIRENKKDLIPSANAQTTQKLNFKEGLSVITRSELEGCWLEQEADVIIQDGAPACRIRYRALSDATGYLAVCLRPYNPEGISFIQKVKLLDKENGWLINDKIKARLDHPPARYKFSTYREGDVYHHIYKEESRREVSCDVGMATAAALYKVEAGTEFMAEVYIPLDTEKRYKSKKKKHDIRADWDEALAGTCKLNTPNKKLKFLYEAALRTVVLHSPGTIYPGPYTYKKFWFRDAAFITTAMVAAGLRERVRRCIEEFFRHQKVNGFFESQEGEWDSNGQVLWTLGNYCRFTGRKPDKSWLRSIKSGADWIVNKRVKNVRNKPFNGLMPAGFSAEHLGPNDFYYWDDFWSVAGLESAAYLLDKAQKPDLADKYRKEAVDLRRSIDESLKYTRDKLGTEAMPASCHRRLDSGAIGSISAGYPLGIFMPNDIRLTKTLNYLLEHCTVKDGFFHDMSHSGINPYLTLHISQNLLRSGDKRFFKGVEAVTRLASQTGQWPEAIHPLTEGGCMGDGQHVWAAAEWILMVRNSFVREEGERLILCSGLMPAWYEGAEEISFGPAHTAFGSISLNLKNLKDKIKVAWQADWQDGPVPVKVQLPGYKGLIMQPDTNCAEIPKK